MQFEPQPQLRYAAAFVLALEWSETKAQIGMSARASARQLHCMAGAAVTHALLLQQSSHKNECRLFWCVQKQKIT